MNKMVKGAVAGTTGIALLMGGFGTYATWTNSQDVDGKIASGTLTIDGAGSASYDDLSTTDVAGDWTASDLMVPGDSVKLTQPLAVTARGKNLKVELSVTGISNNFDFTADELSVTATYAGKTVTFPGVGPYVMSYDADDFDVLNDATAVEVTFDFAGSATGNKAKTLDLTNAVIHVDQVL
jgi:alternate signal-mediated exported protein